MGSDGADDAISAALEAGQEAVDAVRGIPDTQERVEAAGRLADGLRVVQEDAARVRHDGAVDIYKAEDLSLAQLGQRIGVSKARANQILNAAKIPKRRKPGRTAGENRDA